MSISPTAEGFRIAFRRPSLALGEITWRWMVGATATVLFIFGLFEYLDTLPVTNGELLFLRTRHPYFIAQAIAHIFGGSVSRAVMAAMVGAVMLGLLWVVAASVGRIVTVHTLLDHFRARAADVWKTAAPQSGFRQNARPFPALIRLNFLRAATALAAVIGLVGAAILANFSSPDSNPQPVLAFVLFLPLAALVAWAWWALNWLLSLAAMFAVRDGEDTIGAIAAAVSFCRERAGAVFAVSTWTGLAHLAILMGATTTVSVPLGFANILPWRLVVIVVVFVSLAYLAVADWLYMARLAGYVCITEMPATTAFAPSPLPISPMPPTAAELAPLQTTIDRDELILSDVPNPPVGT